jgi:hypothetical protein
MIKANEARAQSAENKQFNALKDVEESIKKAIKKGRNYINTTGNTPKEIKEELENAGYKVETQATGMKISW